jgi:hypothetical protein
MQEQQVNEEFDAARSGYMARREAGAVRYVSPPESFRTGRRIGGACGPGGTASSARSTENGG